jgi:hypothetical protein
MQGKRLLVLASVLAAVACGSRVPEAASSRPVPSPVGKGTGIRAALSIDASGGALVSPDGLLSISVPAGAVATPTSFTIEELATNSAPGGIGKAYRISPSSGTLHAPVVLTFDAAGAGVSAASLPGTTVAYQDGSGFWLRVETVTRDAVAGTVSYTTSHFSDWSLVGASGMDLTGGFNIVSSGSNGSMTFTGTATLAYAGADATERWYLQGGTIAIDPLPAGCIAPVLPIVTNVSEATTVVPPGSTDLAFGWGVSGVWNMACADGTHLVDLAFDTYGVNYLGCTRTASPGNIVAAGQLAGTYTIDCGGGATLTATWNFLPPP